MKQTERLLIHLRRWRSNPLAFIREVLNVEPTDQQTDIILNFIQYRFIAVRSGNKVGKTAVCAWLLIWFMCCFKNARVPCTSPSESQLKKGIWNEVGIWYRNLPEYFKNQFTYTAESLTNTRHGTAWQSYIKTATKERPEVLSGAHSADIFVIMDEGSAIDGEIINNILPLLGSINAYSMIIGNPMRTSGYFFDLFHGKPSIFKKLLHYSAEDSPLMPQETLKAWLEAFGGRDSSYYKIHALGEFPASDSDQLISLYIIDEAKNRRLNKDEYEDADVIWGVDVGLDHDASTLVKRQGRKVYDIKKWRKVKDTVKLCGLIQEEYNKELKKYEEDEEHKDEEDYVKTHKLPKRINIDEIGIGRGTVDVLKGWKLPVFGVNVGWAPKEKGRFANLKAELWFMAKEWLELEAPQIPDDQDLITDLVVPKYQTNPSGKIKIESKDQIRKRIGRSTDTGDGFVLTLYRPKQVKVYI